MSEKKLSKLWNEFLQIVKNWVKSWQNRVKSGKITKKFDKNHRWLGTKFNKDG